MRNSRIAMPSIMAEPVRRGVTFGMGMFLLGVFYTLEVHDASQSPRHGLWAYVAIWAFIGLGFVIREVVSDFRTAKQESPKGTLPQKQLGVLVLTGVLITYPFWPWHLPRPGIFDSLMWLVPPHMSESDIAFGLIAVVTTLVLMSYLRSLIPAPIPAGPEEVFDQESVM